MGEKSSYPHSEETGKKAKLARYEQAFLAGEITEAEFLFFTDPASPTELETRGGLRRSWAVFLSALALLGSGASAALLYEEWMHYKYPLAALSCSINKYVSCLDGITSWQGHLLMGTPNALWGMILFLTLLGLGIWLLSGQKINAWFWRVLLLGSLLGSGLVLWFMQVSLFTLGSLCPFCMVIWASVLWIFWLLLAVNLRRPLRIGAPVSGLKRGIIRYWYLGAILSCFLLALASLAKFGPGLFGVA